MEGPRRCGVVLALVFVVATRPARADGTALELARHDVESSDYLAARPALVAALDAGTAGPAELAEIYKLSGIVEGALDDEAAATSAFEKWLALDPKGELPPGTSPKIADPYEAAAAHLAKRAPLKVKAETSSQPPSVTVIVASDPDRMISRARVFVIADGKPEITVEGVGKHRIVLALPHGKRLDLRVQALDKHGNRVVELGTTDVPIVITGAEKRAPSGVVVTPPKPTEPPPEPRPIWLRWWAWGAVAGVFAGAGTYFGFAARSDASQLDALNLNSQDHQFPEATDLESHARTDVLLFNIGMGAAGAFAVGAAILYLTEPKATVERRLTVVPARGGGTVVFGGRF
jgi:hypothetical protein